MTRHFKMTALYLGVFAALTCAAAPAQANAFNNNDARTIENQLNNKHQRFGHNTNKHKYKNHNKYKNKRRNQDDSYTTLNN